MIALQWELFSGKVLSPCIPHFFQVLQPVGGNFFSGKVPLTLYSTLFSRLDEKIIKLFCGKTVGTLSTLLIESEKHLSRNLFSDKEKAEKEEAKAQKKEEAKLAKAAKKEEARLAKEAKKAAKAEENEENGQDDEITIAE